MNEYKKLKSLFYQNKDIWEKTYESRINSESVLLFNILDDNIPFFVMLTPELIIKMEQIFKLDKQLLLTMSVLPSVAVTQYRKACLVDEIKMTNAIEGVRSTRKEILNVIDKIDNKKNIRLKGLVKKYIMLENKTFEITSCTDIRDIYNELVLDEVVAENSDHAPDGKIFRNDVVQIHGSHMNVLHKGIIDEEHIIRAIQKTIDIMNNEELSILIKVPVVHYLLGYIHPFYDGNGRLMRYISSKMLTKVLVNIVGYRLAYSMKQNMDAYMKLFKDTNEITNRRDLTLFVSKFFDLIIESLKDLSETLIEKDLELKFYYEKVDCIYTEKEDAAVVNIAFILVQATLFGEDGIDINNLSIAAEKGLTKTRTSIKYLESRDLILKKKIGNKVLYSINLENIKTL